MTTKTTVAAAGVDAVLPLQRREDGMVAREEASVQPDAPSAADAGPAGAGTKLAYALLGTVLFAYWVSLIVRPNGQTWTWLDGWGVSSFELLTSCLVIARALARPWDRRYALLLGIGGCSWALGDFAMTYETLGGASPSSPSLANFLWAGFFPAAYLGLLVLMRRDIIKVTGANLLDGLVVVLVAAAALVAFGFHDISHASGEPTAWVATNLVYPVADIPVFGLIILGMILAGTGHRARWCLIGIAALANVAGDSVAMFPNGIGGSHVGFVLNSAAWPTSLFFISCAVWLVPGTGRTPRENNASGFLVPTVASGLALAVLLAGTLERASVVAVAFAVAGLVAAGARFGLALRRLSELNEQRHRELEHSAGLERESREGLERAAEHERESRDALQTALGELEHSATVERESREALQAAVHSYADFAAKVANGDLTATVTANDSVDMQALSESLNRMASGLAGITVEIKAGVQGIGTSTAEILATVSQHAESATQQAATIQQTSATVNELRGSADETARRASDVARQASESVTVSDAGTTAVTAISDAMHEIRERVTAVTNEIQTLSERTQRIGEITTTVNQIAGRSNLLALNASIEAARAGEHGKTFAIVADQMRQLAEQSNEATSQVETILSDVELATSASVAASEEGSRVVDRGLELTTRADQGIRSLADTIREASTAAQQIAASAQEQSAGMDLISGAMTDIERATGEFLDGSQHSQQAANTVDGLAAKLTALIARYRVSEHETQEPTDFSDLEQDTPEVASTRQLITTP
jgi:methyl-accepting chemotaxis protein